MPTIVQPPGAHGGPSSPPSPPAPGDTQTATQQTPHMHHGWADLRNSMNNHLPRQLVNSDTAIRAAYRVLAGKSRPHRKPR